MKYTLLELVQRVLESIDSDEVSSYNDTTESIAVANIIKECYYEIVSDIVPKETTGLFQFDNSLDPALPAVAYKPEYVSSISEIQYNIGELSNPNLRCLEYVDMFEFIQRTNGLDAQSDWVSVQTVPIQGRDFTIKYRTDKFPTFWTCPDDKTLIFDSVSLEDETTITNTRCYGFGAIVPVFTLANSFVPLLDARQFQLLLNSAKAMASVELKQVTNEKAERRERKHRILANKTKDNTDGRPEIKRIKGYGR